MFFFFFFQAEDGIRDLYVTGVQTCALPILPHENPTGPKKKWVNKISFLRSLSSLAAKNCEIFLPDFQTRNLMGRGRRAEDPGLRGLGRRTEKEEQQGGRSQRGERGGDKDSLPVHPALGLEHIAQLGPEEIPHKWAEAEDEEIKQTLRGGADV